MPETSLIRRETALLQELARLTAERAQAETTVEGTFAAGIEAADRQHAEIARQVEARYRRDVEATETTAREATEKARAEAESRRQALAAKAEEFRRKVAARGTREREAADRARDEAHWQALALFESAGDAAKKWFEEVDRHRAELAANYEPVQQLARAQLDADARLLGGPVASPGLPAELEPDDPVAGWEAILADLDARLANRQALFVPKLAGPGAAVGLAVLVAALLAAVLGVALGGGPAAVGGALGAAGGVGLWIWLRSIARRHVAAADGPLARALADAEALGERLRPWATEELKARRDRAERERAEAARLADEIHAPAVAESGRRRDEALRHAEESLARQLGEIDQRRDAIVNHAEEARIARLAELKRDYEATVRDLKAEHDRRVDQAHADREAGLAAMVARWRAGTDAARAELEAIHAEDRRLFPRPEDVIAGAWTLPEATPPVMRLGEFAVSSAELPGGLPRDPALRAMAPGDFTLPALVPFPERGSVLIKAADEGRGPAAEVLQALMLRLLTALPPGKVRFTIVDPVGLGRNFAGFMHLADVDEQLVTSRIWTEAPQIEQRLADLSEHMENVIQAYLRNEFENIEEYNAQAGEVAEPYRVLVIADFPANISETAARRLTSIATAGPRCGVYTLISVDTKLQLPAGFSMEVLERGAVNLTYKGGRFYWKDESFGRYPLALDAAPTDEALTPVLRTVGEAARAAKRVEVPFEVIAPEPGALWTADSSHGIDVPLGRAGATKLQHLRLGKGTAQHVLIAGRTGSGKSTLLHALITNLALHYGPDQVELYLIDFKKGVEFKTYASHELPHARVVAVESEREFGLSVLQRLDAELKERGERFRAVGAQDLAAYRRADGKTPTPRILLIVDEFQEFFVEDDRVAQEASLLLDRLVRQGRAFGIHVHLGSQTLSGAYSLARSTLGQMAVRIALQCSETDAHLILSEENSAARLLSRPGEAIYNDANGMVEGNHFFQVVWLDDVNKDAYLDQLRELAQRRGYVPPRPQLVFEGNTPADVAKNGPLEVLLESPDWPTGPRAGRAWLGEAIAIKDPTAAEFRPQGGNNLLIVGQQPEAARGMLATALVGLAAQFAPAEAKFYVLDGTPADSPQAGLFERLSAVVPHPFRVGGPREAPAILAEVAEEVGRRQSAEGPDPSAVFLVAFDLQRFRDLRRGEDDFGFSSSRFGGEEAPASPSQQFSTVLREGSGLGVHTLAWADSLTTTNRALDRQAMREFANRVLFQMSANDSSSLIDSPVAGKLGMHRALFYSEEQALLEKFRPYHFPPDEWLERVKARLLGRGAAQEVGP